MDSFVYKWTNITLNKIYIGFHKGSEDDGYICSSGSNEFWDDFNNPNYVWEREILFKGGMKECQLSESKLLDAIDIKSPLVYNNRNNIMFNITDSVREKLKKSAINRGQNPEYRKAQSDRARANWANNTERRKLQSERAKHQTMTDETREKIKIARAKQIITPESRLKAAEKLKGKSRPQEVKNAISLARKNAPDVKCPHCGIFGKLGGSMSRWHFNNCKELK